MPIGGNVGLVQKGIADHQDGDQYKGKNGSRLDGVANTLRVGIVALLAVAHTPPCIDRIECDHINQGDDHLILEIWIAHVGRTRCHPPRKKSKQMG